MEDINLFNKYRSKMIWEGCVKSAVCGLIVGCAVNFISALVCWLCGYAAGVWLSVGLGAGVAVLGAVLFYFMRFRPKDVDVARRVDGLGLQERMITMLELQNDDSYIAKRQREDARLHMGSLTKKLKMQISKALIGVVCVAATFAVAMTTVEGLAIGGVLPSGSELTSPPVFIEVYYLAEEGGEIDGLDMQILEEGEEPEPVMAVWNEDYNFIGWDDGWEEPYRDDAGKITESVTFTARFEKINSSGTGTGDPNGEGGGEGGGDDAEDKPVDAGGESDNDASQGGNGGESGGGNTDDNPNKPSQPGEGGDGDGSGAGGGNRYDEANQIIDGETYYRDELEAYYKEVMELLASDKELTPEEKAFIEKYFNSL